MSDAFDLRRILDTPSRVYADVVAELTAGRKRSHWMWYVFPQIVDLGASPTSVFYAISSLDEAGAWADHPVLGERLRDCEALVLAVEGKTAAAILGRLGALRLRSSMKLFEAARPEQGARDRSR